MRDIIYPMRRHRTKIVILFVMRIAHSRGIPFRVADHCRDHPEKFDSGLRFSPIMLAQQATLFSRRVGSDAPVLTEQGRHDTVAMIA